MNVVCYTNVFIQEMLFRFLFVKYILEMFRMLSKAWISSASNVTESKYNGYLVCY